MEHYYRGTKFSFKNNDSEDENHSEYILAECYEEGFIFQIISLSGYSAGLICGHVKNSNSLLDSGYKAITKDNLIDEINRNFQNVIISSVKISKTEN